MPVNQPEGDLARAKVHEPDMSWPDKVTIVLEWEADLLGNTVARTLELSREEFFGTRGAPMPGEALIAHIERLRRLGPPPPRKRK